MKDEWKQGNRFFAIGKESRRQKVKQGKGMFCLYENKTVKVMACKHICMCTYVYVHICGYSMYILTYMYINKAYDHRIYEIAIIKTK